MKKKLTLMFFFICFAQTISYRGQVKEKEKFTKQELISFLKIYKHTLDHPFDPLVSLHNHYKKSNLSEERLTEILQAQFSDTPINITNAEKIEMQKLKEFVENDKKAFDENLNKFISENNLTTEKYNKIKKLYHEDTNFQKKVLKILKS